MPDWNAPHDAWREYAVNQGMTYVEAASLTGISPGSGPARQASAATTRLT